MSKRFIGSGIIVSDALTAADPSREYDTYLYRNALWGMNLYTYQRERVVLIFKRIIGGQRRQRKL